MRPALEVADVLRRHGPVYAQAHDGHRGRIERRVMSAIEFCRTPALGGHIEACDDCDHSRIAYNSCRNRLSALTCPRHVGLARCPKCQATARERWIAAREADLLPILYFHVVFTVPAEIAAIAYQNKPVLSACLAGSRRGARLRDPVRCRGRDT